MDYGFPSGDLLMRTIVSSVLNQNTPEFVRLSQLMGEVGVSKSRVLELAKLIQNTPVQSIDALLEKRDEFINEGKFGIAYQLIQYENADAIFGLHKRCESWYQYLWNLMQTDDVESFHNNRLSVVTFNYDRSFEFFLRQSLCNLYKIDDQKAANILTNVPVVHLHGQLGNLPVNEKGGRPYTNQLTPEAIAESMDGIKIIHEASDFANDPQFKRAYELFEDAQQIAFLGFGYHPTNVQRLKLRENGKLTGTVYGFTSKEVGRIREMLPYLNNIREEKVLEFLRSSGILWEK